MCHRHLLPALLLLVGTLLTAADGMPPGLPHEHVVLRDGRHLTGHYDEAQGVLWLDGAGSPRLRVAPHEIAKRTPVVVVDRDGKKPRTPANATVPLPTTLPSVESLQQALATIERQIGELDRRMAETREAMTRINAHLQEWLKVYAKAQKIAEADPGTGLGYENNASYNLTKIRSEIKAVRELLTRQEDTLARQNERRKELLAGQREAQQALDQAKARTTTPYVTIVTTTPTPDADARLEERVAALEAELRAMRQDNERLRRMLESLTPTPKPEPEAPRPSLGGATPETDDDLVAVRP